MVKRLDELEAHDYDAAADYLGVLGESEAAEKAVAALRTVEPVYRKANVQSADESSSAG